MNHFATKHPDDSYKCGIFSLVKLGKLIAPGTFQSKQIMETVSSPAGFSAGELVRIANEGGLVVNSFMVDDWSKLPIPCVIHQTVEHFIVVLEKRGDFYKINDPVIGGFRWIILPELTEEASGCILASHQFTGAVGTRALTAEQANQYRGRCHNPEPIDHIEPGFPIDDDDDFPYIPGADGGYPSKTCCGMPYLQISEPGLNPWLVDRPLRYSPAYGPEINFALTWMLRRTRSDITGVYNFGSQFGIDWTSSWLCWVELDDSGNLAEMVLKNGAGAHFEFSGSNTSDVYYRLNMTLEKVLSGTNITALKLHYWNGKTVEFAHKYASTDATIFHMTKEYDRGGNYTSYAYDNSTHYLTNVVAADTVSFEVQYGLSGSPQYITNILASYGASAGVAYELQSPDEPSAPLPGIMSVIKDAAGIESYISHESRLVPRKLRTPYGLTEFWNYFDATLGQFGMFDRVLQVTHPNGDKELWTLLNSYPVNPPTFPAWPSFSGQTPSVNPTGTVDTTDRSERNTFHWTVGAWDGSWDTNNYTWAQFVKARIRHWVTDDSYGSTHFDTLSSEQSPTVDGGTTQGRIKWYDYANKLTGDPIQRGTQILPSETSTVMPDGTTTYKVVTRNSLGKLTAETESWVDNGTRKYRSHSYTYSADGIDLLEHRFDPSGVNRLVVGYGYDVSHPHLPVRITNGLNEITYRTYDAYHRLVTVTTPSGFVASNTFGGDGFVSKTVEYDAVNPLRTNSFTFTQGLLQTHTDPRGLTISNSWDYLRRLTRIDYPDGTYLGYAYTNGFGVMLRLLRKTGLLLREFLL